MSEFWSELAQARIWREQPSASFFKRVISGFILIAKNIFPIAIVDNNLIIRNVAQPPPAVFVLANRISKATQPRAAVLHNLFDLGKCQLFGKY